jgi:Uma2 family endonuclease
MAEATILALQPLSPLPPRQLYVKLGIYVKYFFLILAAGTGRLQGHARLASLAPDVAFVRAANAPLTETDDFPRLAPDVVGEVASPGDSRRRMAARVRRWLERGVRLVGVVWPRRREIDVWRPGEAEAYTLTAADTLDGGTVVPGFSIPVARVCLERPRPRKHSGQYKGEQ